MSRLKLDKESEKNLEQLDKMKEEMEALTVDEINKTSLAEVDPQTLMSKKEVEIYDAPKIKPTKSFAPIGKPEAKEADARKKGWEYIKCIAENLESRGEIVEFWLNKFKGDPVYFWQVPVNKPIYLPRFVAEYLSTRNYHRFKMQDRSIHEMSHDEPLQKLVAKETLRRIDCRSVGFGF